MDVQTKEVRNGGTLLRRMKACYASIATMVERRRDLVEVTAMVSR